MMSVQSESGVNPAQEVSVYQDPNNMSNLDILLWLLEVTKEILPIISFNNRSSLNSVYDCFECLIDLFLLLIRIDFGDILFQNNHKLFFLAFSYFDLVGQFG